MCTPMGAPMPLTCSRAIFACNSAIAGGGIFTVAAVLIGTPQPLFSRPVSARRGARRGTLKLLPLFALFFAFLGIEALGRFLAGIGVDIARKRRSSRKANGRRPRSVMREAHPPNAQTISQCNVDANSAQRNAGMMCSAKNSIWRISSSQGMNP